MNFIPEYTVIESYFMDTVVGPYLYAILGNHLSSNLAETF